MQRVEYLRRIRGMSKTELSRRMGIHPTTVHELLGGRRPWTDYYRTKAAAIFALDPAAVDEIVADDAR